MDAKGRSRAPGQAPGAGKRGVWELTVDKLTDIDYNEYMKAKSGGKNYGTFVTLSAQSDEQLLRSINSYSKNVAEHKEKIANPYEYVDDWERRNHAYKAGIIKKWQKDIARNGEQLDIAKGIAVERGLLL